MGVAQNEGQLFVAVGVGVDDHSGAEPGDRAGQVEQAGAFVVC
jgi:hypothetical protein